MVHEVVRAVARRPSSLVLVASSIVSAVAAVAGLDLWVSLLAAVAAVISGGQVVRRDIVVPLRLNRVTEATAVVQTRPETGGGGTAVQVRPGVWLMSAYLPTEDCYQLLLDGGWRLAHVLRRDDGLLLLGCAYKMRSVAAALTSTIPSQGDPVGVVGWTTGLARPIRIRQDYIAQALTSDQQLVLTGQNPQHGFGGAPAVVPSSGKICGLVTGFNPGPAPATDYVAALDEVYVSCLSHDFIHSLRHLAA